MIKIAVKKEMKAIKVVLIETTLIITDIEEIKEMEDIEIREAIERKEIKGIERVNLKEEMISKEEGIWI